MNKVQTGIHLRGKQVGFCYIVGTGGHFKIGKSIDVDGVVASAKRFDAGAQLLTCWTVGWMDDAEKTLHEGLKKWRVEREQFRMPSEVVRWLSSLCDREFAGWWTETNCDDRAVGWDFPRIYTPDGKRAWPCLIFPESDVPAWAMICSEMKPEYSLVEQAWFQDHRGFNSVWLGRPQKNGGPRPTHLQTQN